MDKKNFANARAIIELVKNGYDAGAKNCIIIFDNIDVNPLKPSIYIIDNSVGMTDKEADRTYIWLTVTVILLVIIEKYFRLFIINN